MVGPAVPGACLLTIAVPSAAVRHLQHLVCFLVCSQQWLTCLQHWVGQAIGCRMALLTLLCRRQCSTARAFSPAAVCGAGLWLQAELAGAAELVPKLQAEALKLPPTSE